MADSIRAPWILDYLISAAEQYGANLAAAPRTEKAQKGQIIKFLTFAPQGSTAPCVIWADVSDKKHFIHARLSIDAIERFMKTPMSAGASITSYKSALVSLKKVRIAFGRVARRERGGGMTEHPRLYLDVDEVDVLGSYGEPMWGAPVDISQDVNIKEWMFGLQQDGGGGNVLKLKKERLLAQAAEHADKLQADHAVNLRQTTMDVMNVKVQVARKSAAHKARSSTGAPQQRPIASKEAVRRASWKRVHTKMMQYSRPPDDVFEQLLLLSGISEESNANSTVVRSPRHLSSPHSRSRSSSVSNTKDKRDEDDTPPRRSTPSSSARTPSQWSPSVLGSPHADGSSSTEDEDDDLFDEDADDPMDDEDMLARSSVRGLEACPDDDLLPLPYPGSLSEQPLPMPQPAQPRIAPPPSSMLSIPYATSPQRPSSPPVEKSSRGPFRDIDALPPSSPPAPSHLLPPSPTSSPRHVLITPARPVPAVRRVPLPQYNPLRRDPDASGEGRVLVENSDTASPGSLHHSQSQSQSQGQGRSGAHATSQSDGSGGSQGQNQPASQPQRPSQLRNEIGQPAPAEDEGGAHDVTEQSGQVAGIETEETMESQELQSQPPVWTQQSLSYKGDSQSQEGAAPQPPADADNTQPPEAQAPIDEAFSNVADDAAEVPQEEEDSVANKVSAVGEREPSPMEVEQDNSAAEVVVVGGLSWTVIRRSTTEDSEESQDEVDELLSDPITTLVPEPRQPRKPRTGTRAGRPKATAKKTAVKTSGDTGEKLDLDDARTAEMVNKYKFELKAQELIRARNRRNSLLPSAPEHTAAGEPIRKDRQVKSKDSQRDAGPNQSSQLAHDPSIWTAPTFMRKSTSKAEQPPARPVQNVKVEEPSPKVLPEPQKRKRAARPSSPTPNREQSPAKKRKTDAVPIPVPVPSTTVDPPPRKKQTSLVPKTAPNHDRPSASTSSSTFASTSKAPLVPRDPSTSSSRSITRAPSAVPKPRSRAPTGPTDAGNSRETKFVDLRGSSRSSSRASRAPEGARSRPAGSAASTRTSEPVASSGAKGKVKAASSSAARSNSSIAGGSADPAARPGPSRAMGVVPLDLELTRTPGGPPLLGWDDLMGILLKTGKTRYQRERERQAGGGGGT
ncbi:hypothetical protein C2E23DRAFT_800798 [Lenzites betulinus]|nr:hypothetical protein C2E23DRAFT_800798 [Lenzites betulinus]